MDLLFNSIGRNIPARKLFDRLVLACFLAFPSFFASFGTGPAPVLAQAEPGTIAYVAPDAVTGDEIRLIEPDGSGDRLLWKTGVPGAAGLVQISALAWHPGASDLAFASRHEESCSFYASDIYAIHADGSGYRRVTAPPACGRSTGLPTGTVRVSIDNETAYSGPFYVYFEGAPAPQVITLSPGGAMTVTFNNVADYGSMDQWASVTFGDYRYTSVSGNADVLPGKTVATDGTIFMYYPSTDWSWSSPSWKSDGSKIAYLLDVGIPYAIAASSTQPGMIGGKLFNVADTQLPYNPEFLSWAPAGPRANQVLYVGYDSSFYGAVYLADAGSASAGSQLVQIDPSGIGNHPLGLAWLPDSSGFLYSKTEGFGEKANIFEYSFSTHASTRITNFTGGYPRQLSVSPDGTRIVYEYQASGEWTDLNPSLDLWIMDRDGSDQALFVENGREPAWSPHALPEPAPPVVLDHPVFLPMVIRK